MENRSAKYRAKDLIADNEMVTAEVLSEDVQLKFTVAKAEMVLVAHL